MPTIRQPEYKYRRYNPSSHRFQSFERVGHQVAYTVRTNILLPVGTKGRITYLPRCSCGWVEPDEKYVSRRVMYLRFDAHVRELDKQGTLWPNY